MQDRKAVNNCSVSSNKQGCGEILLVFVIVIVIVQVNKCVLDTGAVGIHFDTLPSVSH